MVVEVSRDDFLRTHAGLVSLLRRIAEAGHKGIPTRRLCYDAFGSRSSYCIALLDKAEKQGLIRRDKEPPPGKGNKLMVNRITPAGKKLLRVLNIDLR
jgi:hypothetical protein